MSRFENWLKSLYLKWVYRFVDEDLCCCGSYMGQGGSICGHGGCRSAKEYAMSTHFTPIRSTEF